jgi:tetratricopeptide (TPR) repeat protein
LLERAAALPPADDRSRLAVLPDLAGALIESGQFDEARRQLGDALSSGDELIRAHARLIEGKVDVFQGGDFEAFGALTEEVQQVFERHGDELGIATALWERSEVVWSLLRAEDAAELMTAALVHAEHAQARRLTNEIRWLLSSSFLHGPMPVEEIAPKLDELHAHTANTVLGESTLARGQARLAVMRGDFEEARRLADPAWQAIADAGLAVLHAAMAQLPAFIEDGAGNYPAEEQILRENVARLEALGERPYFATLAATLARCLADQGKDEEALEFARLAREKSPAGDLINFIGADAAEARVLARRGELDRAERLATGAVARAEQTDFWDVRSSTHLALGEVLAQAGNAAAARAEYETAAQICEQKGAGPWAERARRMVAELQ